MNIKQLSIRSIFDSMFKWVLPILLAASVLIHIIQSGYLITSKINSVIRPINTFTMKHVIELLGHDLNLAVSVDVEKMSRSCLIYHLVFDISCNLSSGEHTHKIMCAVAWLFMLRVIMKTHTFKINLFQPRVNQHTKNSPQTAFHSYHTMMKNGEESCTHTSFVSKLPKTWFNFSSRMYYFSVPVQSLLRPYILPHFFIQFRNIRMRYQNSKGWSPPLPSPFTTIHIIQFTRMTLNGCWYHFFFIFHANKQFVNQKK